MIERKFLNIFTELEFRNLAKRVLGEDIVISKSNNENNSKKNSNKKKHLNLIYLESKACLKIKKQKKQIL